MGCQRVVQLGGVDGVPGVYSAPPSTFHYKFDIYGTLSINILEVGTLSLQKG